MFLLLITVVNNAAAQTPYLTSTSLTRSIQENLAIGTKVGEPMKGIDPDGDTITYGITYGSGSYAYFAINRTTGQLSTKQILDYEANTSHTIRVSVNDPGGNSNTYDITINVINDTSDDNTANRPPEFIEGDSTARNIILSDPNSLYLGSPILATDPDGGTLYYAVTNDPSGILYMGNPAWENTVKWRHENLAQLKHQLLPDLRSTSDTYTAELTVWDDQNATDSIQITINIVAKNTPPIFLDGSSTTRSIKENTDASIEIGAPIYAIDCEDRVLKYSLGGTDASSFTINTNTGQLQTLAALDYETKSTYTVTVNASDDNGGSVSITVNINVIDVTEVVPNNPPVFSDGAATTRSIAENTPSGRNIGGAVTATDPDRDTLTYSLSGSDTASFGIVPTSGQLQTVVSLDYETKNTYTVTVNVSDGNGGSDSITVTINVIDVTEGVPNNPPVFLEGASTTRSIPENTPSNRNIGEPVFATDKDPGDTLTCSLSGTDAHSFSIVNTTGQLRTAAPLDFETKNIYSVMVNVSDGNGGSDSITVTINVTDVNETETLLSVVQNSTPVFLEGASTTRSIPENTPSNRNIGEPVSATDVDSDDTLTYSLSGADAASFSIVNTSGQLHTAAPLDYETKNTYSVIVNVSDGNGGSNSITITINVDPDLTIIPFDYKKEGIGKVVFSELMLASIDKLPQWIELYNTTNQDIDVKGWKIVGRYSDDLNTSYTLISQVISKSLTIKSKETVLIVSYATPNSIDRISSDLADKTYALGANNRNFWNYKGLVLELQDAEGNPIDRIGNLNENNEIIFEIPLVGRKERVSLIRRLKSIRTQKYDWTFGMKKFGWFPANEVERLAKGRSQYYYGRHTDIGSPGYRTEGTEILPVTLSQFNPQKNQDGSVVISWITESEVDNAGFNILRSNAKKGPFVKVNPKLIQGAGTTGERSAYTWVDTTAKPNIEYYYQIEDVSLAGIKQTLATQRLKGIHTAKNRAITSWGIIKQVPNK